MLFDNIYKQDYIIVNTLYISMSFKNNVKINSTLHVITCGAESTKIEGASSGLNIFLVHMCVIVHVHVA